MENQPVIIVSLCLVLITGVLTDPPSFSHRLCSGDFTCLSKTECFKQHITTNSLRLQDTIIFSCSADKRYVCCPHLPEGSEIKIRNPEMNKRLLPIDDCGEIPNDRILGGQEAGLGQFPWMTLLAYRPSGNSGPAQYLCGGTLISTRYVLTAAHCVNTEGLGNPVHVRLGELNLSTDTDCDDLYCSDPPVDIEIEKIIAHENFNNTSVKNDIALLRLKTNVNVTLYTSPICLPFNEDITGEEETKYIVAGWGKIKDQSVNGSDALLFAYVPSVPVSECDEVMPIEVKPVNELQLCAGATGESDACKGDSGGPMMNYVVKNTTGEAKAYQIGIVSFSVDKCGSSSPSVYTRVGSYLTWILTNLEP